MSEAPDERGRPPQRPTPPQATPPPPQTLPFGSADAAWLHMESVTNLMVINSLVRFQGPLPLPPLEEVIQRRLVDAYPKFGMLIEDGGPPLSRPHWARDRHFHLSRHIHRVALPSPHDEETLRDLVSDLVSTPLPSDRPLWQLHVIEEIGEAGEPAHEAGESALLVRMHHCIADGIALARVLLSLTDEVEAAGQAQAQAPAAAPSSPPRSTAGQIVSGISSVAEEGIDALLHPRRALHLAREGVRDVQVLLRLLLMPDDPEGALKAPLSGSRTVGWCEPVSLQLVKDVAHRHNATVNDVLLSAVSGALRHQMLGSGEPLRQMRAIVPFNLRPLTEPVPSHLGNRFGLVFLELPVEIGDRKRRLKVVKGRMDEIKRSPEGPVSYAVLQAMGLTPTELESRFVSLFSSKGTMVITNVPGPTSRRTLAGATVKGLQVWAPTSGSVGMSVSIFSYGGSVSIGLMADESLHPHPQSIAEEVPAELQAMAALKSSGTVAA